jgi:hypothetical protein
LPRVVLRNYTVLGCHVFPENGLSVKGNLQILLHLLQLLDSRQWFLEMVAQDCNQQQCWGQSGTARGR